MCLCRCRACVTDFILLSSFSSFVQTQKRSADSDAGTKYEGGKMSPASSKLAKSSAAVAGGGTVSYSTFVRGRSPKLVLCSKMLSFSTLQAMKTSANGTGTNGVSTATFASEMKKFQKVYARGGYQNVNERAELFGNAPVVRDLGGSVVTFSFYAEHLTMLDTCISFRAFSHKAKRCSIFKFVRKRNYTTTSTTCSRLSMRNRQKWCRWRSKWES